MHLLFLILALASVEEARAAKLRISPQYVVERLLSDGRDAREVTLMAETAEVGLHKARAAYDWNLGAATSYEDSRAVALSGFTNVEDKTTVWQANLSKKIPTGTTLGLAYARTRQDSVFRPNSTSSRPANVYLDNGELSVTQDISGNFFGVVDRSLVNLARRNIQKADLEKKESLEDLVLDGVRLFWQTYVAKESLREALQARDKYATLVKDVEKKARLGFVNQGDLPKARAEYEAQSNLVKQASLELIQLTDQLVTILNLTAKPDELELVGDRDLPPLPNLRMRDPAELRKIVAGTIALDSAALEKHVAALSGLPTIQVVGKLGYTGLESTPSQAFATMTSGVSPKYSVALQMTYAFFSEGTKANVREKNINHMLQETRLSKTQDQLRDVLRVAAEKVKANRAVAENSISALKYWEQAIKAQERSYRQGKLDFSQLVIDYNSYFRAQSQRTKAIGNYHIALNEFAAANDRLIE